MPTLEVTLLSVKVNTPPTLFVPLALFPESYLESDVPVPEKTLLVADSSKNPQK